MSANIYRYIVCKDSCLKYKGFKEINYQIYVDNISLLELISKIKSELYYYTKLIPIELEEKLDNALKINILLNPSDVLKIPSVYSNLINTYYIYKQIYNSTLLINYDNEDTIKIRFGYKPDGKAVYMCTKGIFDKTYVHNYFGYILYDELKNIKYKKYYKGTDSIDNSINKDLKENYTIKLLFYDKNVYGEFTYNNKKVSVIEIDNVDGFNYMLEFKFINNQIQLE